MPLAQTTRRTVLVLALMVVPAVAPAAATAHPPDRRACGYLDGDGFGYKEKADGAYTLVRTHVTSCRRGAKVIRASYRVLSRNGGTRWRVTVNGRKWRCRYVEQGTEYSKLKCAARGDRRVIWETGA